MGVSYILALKLRELDTIVLFVITHLQVSTVVLPLDRQELLVQRVRFSVKVKTLFFPISQIRLIILQRRAEPRVCQEVLEKEDLRQEKMILMFINQVEMRRKRSAIRQFI